MKRIHELIEEIRQKYPTDTFFENFESRLESDKHLRAQYKSYEKALCVLDETSWRLLKKKAINHYRQHRPGQLKEAFFNQLNEAFAYAFLVRRGYSNIYFVPEDGVTRPDLSYQDRGRQLYCEVKTIGLSGDEIERRKAPRLVDYSAYQQLSEGFLNKLGCHICHAQKQIVSQGGDAGLIYVVVRFDDLFATYYSAYRKQLVNFLHKYPAQDVYLRMGICRTRRIYRKKVEAHSTFFCDSPDAHLSFPQCDAKKSKRRINST